jgi:hypothetical protein
MQGASMGNIRYFPLILAFFMAGLIACSSAAPKAATKSATLIGKWDGVDRTGKPGAFHFFEDGSIMLVIDGKSLGGADSNSMGRMKYTVDYTKDPIELDIIGIDPSGVERGKILMIVKFISKDKIKIRSYFNDSRPQNFDEETIDDTILLDRKIE